MKERENATIQHHSSSFNDVDEQALYIRGWNQNYEQISAGSFTGYIEELWINHIQFINEYANQSVHQIGTCWENSCCFIIPLQQNGHALFQNKIMTINTPMILHANEVLDYRTSTQQHAIGIVLNNDILIQLSSLRGCQAIERLLKKDKTLSFDQSHLPKLKQSLTQLFQMSKSELFYSNHLNRNYILEHIFSLLFSSFQIDQENAHELKIPSYRKIVNKTKELIMNDPSLPPTISEICRQLGVSQRTLQICFHEIMDACPKQYLKAIRLNQVRRCLKQADPMQHTIQDIAFNWGFWHASHFTASYKAMFGELPSQTFMHSKN